MIYQAEDKGRLWVAVEDLVTGDRKPDLKLALPVQFDGSAGLDVVDRTLWMVGPHMLIGFDLDAPQRGARPVRISFNYPVTSGLIGLECFPQ